ncbi:hypothetical protein ASPCAL08211 [Aspergillus calidoustus]|uniref:Eisosome protein 1 n=1 Tax=Aspergillus calidoustus TaxID=454130 RepID=A0A0U5GPL0_ASPCI|nr:hypothetical protein ASPCAL08211 [Aspergillus calidoustus]
MAAVEHNPAAQERIPHTRSTRLADQAATAALYVTHPERSISMREPTKPEPTSSSRPGLSNASAAAALIAHRKWDLGGKEPATHVADRQKTASPSYGGYPYQAAMYAVREGQITAATHDTRRRADSAPSEAARASAAARIDNPSDPFDDLDKYMNASRIQNAHMNRKMFTATPPVAPELDDHRRRSILEAASMSMAKDMYATSQSKEAGSSGTQRLPTRARSQRSPSKQDAATLQQASTMMLHQALNLQDVAEKRAAEKLALLEDETAGYRNYYGIERQPTRSSFVLRRRRGSNETEQIDAERSKEIRTQMTALRSKLDAVDEKREKDRASLLELARKNVDATMQDIEKRMYTEGGRTVAMQKYLDEKAQERAQKGLREMDTQYLAEGRVNISAQKYVEMADVEDLARHRLQPTFDEIEELAQSQKAREVEARLDEEHRQHLLALEREREAEIEMEQRHHLEQLKQEQKAKEEKVWPWKRKSRHIQDFEPPKETTEDQTQQRVNGAAVAAAPSQGTQTEDQTAASGAGQTEPASRRDSKFKSWFKGRMGHRSSTSLPKGAAVGTQEGEQKESEPTGQDAPRSPSTRGEEYTDAHEMDTEPTEPTKPEGEGEGEGEHEREQRSRPVSGVAHAPEGDSRTAPLRSNPVTARDLRQRTETDVSGDTSNKLDGMTPSEYLNTQRDSQEIVEKASGLKDQRRHEAEGHVHELAAPPAIGYTVGKRTSNGTVRESRFSEDL